VAGLVRRRQSTAWNLAFVLLGLWIAGSVSVIALHTAAITVGLQSTSRDVLGLLDRYERGDSSEVLRELARVRDFDGFRKALAQVAVSWTAADSTDMSRRRLVVATLALEAVRAGLEERWTSVRVLLEWACEWLRQAPQGGPLERQWFLASVALAHRARDVRLLLKFDLAADNPALAGPLLLPPNPVQPYGLKNFDHLSHAEQRFPDEVRFRLARVIAAERPLESVPPRDSAWLDTDALAALAGRSGRARAELDIRAEWVQSINAYRPFLMDTAVAAEANVRVGSLLLRLREYPRALQHLTQVSTSTTDPFLLYLARFFSGQAYEATTGVNEALEAYRAALDVVPDAQSGVVRTAVILYRQGNRSEASTLVAAALRRSPPPDDPWREYSYGTFHAWPGLIARLRAQLRQGTQ